MRDLPSGWSGTASRPGTSRAWHRGTTTSRSLQVAASAQASDAAWQFRDRPIRAIYASDLRRALQTAAAFAAVLGLTVHADARLRERSLGVLEGLPRRRSDRPRPALTPGGWPILTPARPGGESVRDLYRRAAEFVDELAAAVDDEAAGDVVVVAHGGTVRVLEAYLRGISADQMAWGPVGNTAVVRVPDFRAGLPGHPPRSVAPAGQQLLSHPVPRQQFHHSQGGNR